MFGDTSGDGEDVGIENDVLRRKADLLSQNPIGPLANGEFAFLGVGLTLFVKGHNDGGSAILADQSRLTDELGFSFLHADRVHHRLALDALKPGFQNLPFRGIDHHRHPADVRFGGDQIEESDHRFLGIEHPFVHVDIDDLRTVFDLLAGDSQRGVVIAGLDQPFEYRRTGDIGTFADINE